MDERHAMFGSRGAAIVSVIKPADLRYYDNPAFVGLLDRAG
jgi:hypothetical protein